MAHITADRVLELSITVGEGSYVLDGAVIGFRTINSVAASLDTFPYFAEGVDVNGALAGDWEVGVGTLNASGSVARTTIYSSSNNNAAVVWVAGTRRLGIGLSATHFSGLVNRSEIGNLIDLLGVYQLSK